MQQEHEAGGAFHEGANGAAPAFAEDEVAFPVARHGPVINLGGSFGDVDHPRDASPAVGGAALLAAGASGAQASGQLTTQFAAALDEKGLVDRLVAHPHLRVVREVQR